MILTRLAAATLLVAALGLLLAPAPAPPARAERQADPCLFNRFRANPDPLPPDRPNRFGRRRNSNIA